MNPSTKNDDLTGYPRIERLIETENFENINKSFAAAYTNLEKISKQKAGLGKAKQAKKVMKAYELVMNLFKDLLKLKYQLVEANKEQEVKKK